MRRLALLCTAVFAVIVVVALSVRRGGGTRPRSVDKALAFISPRSRTPGWYRSLPDQLKEVVVKFHPSVLDYPPEPGELVAEVLRRDYPGWTHQQRVEFFSRGIGRPGGGMAAAILAALLLDPEGESGWRDPAETSVPVPVPGDLPSWTETWCAIPELNGVRASAEDRLPFDVCFRWRLALEPSAQGCELVLSRRDGSWETRRETGIPADARPEIFGDATGLCGFRYPLFENMVIVETNDATAVVFGIRPAENPDDFPGYDPNGDWFPYELCMPPARIPPRLHPPAPSDTPSPGAETTHAESAEIAAKESHAESVENAEY